LQARHLGKVAGVVGDKHCLMAEGLGGDHGVERANRGTAALKVSPEIAIGQKAGPSHGRVAMGARNISSAWRLRAQNTGLGPEIL